MEKTAEQIAAEQAAAAQAKAAKEAEKAQKAAEKQAEKQAKAAQKEADKAAKAAEVEAAKAQKAADKLAAKELKEKAKCDKLHEKEAAKAKAKADKEAARMPEQNGIRRPKPEGLCGQAWTIFDEVSAKNGSPASISESLEIGRAKNLNEANIRAEYARWRKFHGITGRVDAPKPVAEETKASE